MIQYQFNKPTITAQRGNINALQAVYPPKALLKALPESFLTTYNRYLANWKEQVKKGLNK